MAPACRGLRTPHLQARFKPKMKDQNTAALTQALCLLFVVASYLIANYDTPILEMMSYSWGIISGSFLAPYALALYWKRINNAGAWSGMLGGFLTSFIPVAISGFKTPDGPIYACAAMLISLILCILVSLLAEHFHWKGGERNEFFYTGTAEEWRKTHPVYK